MSCFINNKIVLKLKDIKDNKIKAFFEIDDDLIKIMFDGYLDIK